MDKVRAKRLIGKHILIGMTYLEHDETFIKQEQFHGIIARINDEEGIVIRLNNSDKEFHVPPDLDSIAEAPEGEYRLYSTNEVVVNPHLLARWTVIKPAPDDVVH